MKNLSKFFVYLLVTFMFTQCKKAIFDDPNSAAMLENANARLESKSSDSDSAMVLGKKLENPYSVKNMEIALNSLERKSSKNPIGKIEGNYVYIRILPTTDDQYNLINSDPSIDTYEYPLDYEIVKQGNKYKDKTVSTNKFTWIYCAVPKSKKFDAKIKIEILDELYLPFGNGKEKETEFQKKEDPFLKALEDESLVLTGYKKINPKNGKIAQWYANGRIRVWDDRMNFNFNTNVYQNGIAGFVPVPQCHVRANRWFTTKWTLTNDSGNFVIDHGWGNGDEVNYSIKWERADFDIRDGNYGQSYYNGPKILWSWNLDIQENGTPDNYMYAHVHRAANIYYYKNTYGVISPPTNNFFSDRIHLGTNTGLGRSHYFAFNSAWQAAEIRLIFNLANNDSQSIFATTIHELTHAAHWSIGMFSGAYCANFNQEGRLAESWAQMVGWFITKQIYGPAGLNFTFNDQDAIQNTTFAQMSATASCTSNGAWYTPLFIDLVDNYNQNTAGSFPMDNANGYTLYQLQQFLIAEPANWYKYRDFLQNNSNNPTEAAAVQLFSDYD